MMERGTNDPATFVGRVINQCGIFNHFTINCDNKTTKRGVKIANKIFAFDTSKRFADDDVIAFVGEFHIIEFTQRYLSMIGYANANRMITFASNPDVFF